MSAEVISMVTRQPFEAKFEIEDFLPTGSELPVTGEIVERLLKLLALARGGRLDSFAFIGLDPVTGLFVTDATMPEEVNSPDMISYVGALELMKLEFSERALMAPQINPNGNLVDPYLEDEE